MDLRAEYDAFLQLLHDEKPDTIVHFAEQRAAPYSMKSSKHKRYTVDNNVNVTHNVLAALVECGLDIHLVHLGARTRAGLIMRRCCGPTCLSSAGRVGGRERGGCGARGSALARAHETPAGHSPV